MDDFWSFVGSKSNQRWTWSRLIAGLAWHNGKRQDKDFLILCLPVGRELAKPF